MEESGTTICSVEDADKVMTRIQASAAHVHDWIAAQTGNPLVIHRRMKFDPIGIHPVEDRPLNLIERLASVSRARHL